MSDGPPPVPRVLSRHAKTAWRGNFGSRSTCHDLRLHLAGRARSSCDHSRDTQRFPGELIAAGRAQPDNPDDAAAGCGPRSSRGAEGTVVVEDAGNPVAYVVAAGDNLSSIAERFGISLDDLITRAEAYGAIHPGDELNLVGS